VAKLWRLFASPFQLAAAIVRSNAAVVHVNTSLDARGYLRDLVYLAVAKLLGARVVYQLHDNLFRVFGKPRLAFAPALDLVARWPDAVVLLSEREAEAWRARAVRRHTRGAERHRLRTLSPAQPGRARSGGAAAAHLPSAASRRARACWNPSRPCASCASVASRRTW
jgi:hypothetical protein